MDTTLVGFSDRKWERGDITFIFNGELKPQRSLTVLDNKLCVYQVVRYEVNLLSECCFESLCSACDQETEQEMEDEVDILMSSDIVAAQMPTKLISFSRARSGWLFRGDKTEMIGDFKADFYSIHGLTLESRKRREHLSQEDLQKNKALLENLSKGNLMDCGEVCFHPIQIIPSLHSS
jgi:hypothetical protein